MGSTFSILKLIVGAGSFLLPSVTAAIGFAGLAVSLTLLAALAFYTSWLVVRLKAERAPKEDLSMAEFVGRELGRGAGAVCEACVMGTSAGGCAVYLSFTGQILSQVYCALPNYIYILAMGALVAAFVLLQAVSVVYARWDPLLFLARSSMVGFFAAVAAAVATIVIGAIENDGVGNRPPYLVFDIGSIPDAYGSIAFLFCVALFMFPVHSAIDKPRKFTAALVAGYSVAYLFNLVFSTLGFAVFGAAVQGVVVNSLGTTPQTAAAAKAVQIVLALDVFFTFLVVVVPSAGSVRRALGALSPRLRVDADDTPRTVGSVVVVALAPLIILALCLGLAILVPGVQDLVGIVSALGLSVTALILPALLRLKIGPRNSPLVWVAHIAIIVFASAAGGYTLYTAVRGIVEDYQSGIAGSLFAAACNSTTAA